MPPVGALDALVNQQRVLVADGSQQTKGREVAQNRSPPCFAEAARYSGKGVREYPKYRSKPTIMQVVNHIRT